jgi:precorrin-6A/cobalt-precorrin-6A reductase
MSKTKQRILLLGGTGDARRLAARLVDWPDLTVISSLAGRTRDANRPAGDVRIGGFGGAAGLTRYLQEAAIDAVIDATHPYAAEISANAADACMARGRPLLTLHRLPWDQQPGDRWIDVADTVQAAERLSALGPRVFLTLGQKNLAPFAACIGCRFLVRTIEQPTSLALTNADVIVGRGPFDGAAERALMERHAITGLVSKNSGGDATYGKVEAARQLGLPVVMIARPPRAEGAVAETEEEVFTWLRAWPDRRA